MNNALNLDDPRAFLLALFQRAVQRALPAEGLAAHLPPPPDPTRGRTVVVGAGKAGGAIVELEGLMTSSPARERHDGFAEALGLQKVR